MAERLYQTYLDAIERLTSEVTAAPTAGAAAQSAAQANLDALEQSHRAKTDGLAVRLANAKNSYRRVAESLAAPDLADLGLQLPASLAPDLNASSTLAEAEHDHDRAVVALAGAIGNHRVHKNNAAMAAQEAAEALEARRAALEAARSQPQPRRFNPQTIALIAGLVLLLIVIITLVL